MKFLGIILLLYGAVITAAEPATEKSESTTITEPLSLRNDRILAEQLPDEEAKWLVAGDSKFLGVFKSDISGKAIGSLLILAAPGSRTVSPGVLPQLSNDLSENGWHTLGISTPVLDFSQPKTTSQDDKQWYEEQAKKNMAKLTERLLAAEGELLDKGGKYVLFAQGVSAELVLELISSKVIRPSGLIIVNVQHPSYQRVLKISANLAAITLPILDIYNSQGGQLAQQRKSKQKGTNYRQLYISGNDFHFRGSESLFIKRVRGWLKNNYSKSS